ncbi:flavin reductase family protein [Sinorhizobium sp. BG8]|uniref:flavin reductase family protein n=1 Tax=Sinorhizobium sp. BG8 TaxID=2613773 RepID=UPI00193E5AF7|nr:flavin reductase family protein [Sinorhizobium sp. BG8]QRM57596.1 flavin reductase family protein [Sinorhizobium sp. BG8]
MNVANLIRSGLGTTHGTAPTPDPTLLKSAMRSVSGAVSVITAGAGSERTGATVTSATALSVDPPTMIVNINRSSSTYPVIRRYGHFCVNILASQHQDVANRFAGIGGVKGEARYEGAPWTTRLSGAPVLVGALAAIDCELEEIIERHSHGIVIGRVVQITLGDGQSLVYNNGRYGGFEPLTD